VWTYSGVNTFGKGRKEALAAHPTVKPLALVADALLDCTARGDVVLDQFAGSGTTILAAEKVARVGIGIEYEPRYADVAILRWQRMTKLDATLAGDGRSFEDIGAAREKELEDPNAQRWKSAAGRSPPSGAAEDRRATAFSADKARGNHAGSDGEGSHE
jgi:DNA modification methylase